MNAAAVATQHVVSRLKASFAVQELLPNLIQEGVADERAVFPYVLVQTFGDPEVGFDEAMTTVQLSVRVVQRGFTLSLGALIPLADAVDDALNDSWGKYSDGSGGTSYVTSCTRITEASLSEVAGGRVIRYLGAIYELVVS